TLGANYVLGSASSATNVAFDAVVADLGSVFAPFESCFPSGFDDSLKPEKACRALWVEGATLTSISTKQYTDVAGNANISGYGFGLDGKVYSSNKVTTLDYLVSVNVRLAKRYGNAPPPPGSDSTEHPRVAAAHMNDLFKKLSDSKLLLQAK